MTDLAYSSDSNFKSKDNIKENRVIDYLDLGSEYALSKAIGENLIQYYCKKFNIDLANSYIIGDRFSDIQAGINADLRSTILIKSKHKISEEEKKCASIFCADVDKAADWILELNN